jgi:hypothetical protein
MTFPSLLADTARLPEKKVSHSLGVNNDKKFNYFSLFRRIKTELWIRSVSDQIRLF